MKWKNPISAKIIVWYTSPRRAIKEDSSWASMVPTGDRL